MLVAIGFVHQKLSNPQITEITTATMAGEWTGGGIATLPKTTKIKSSTMKKLFLTFVLSFCLVGCFSGLVGDPVCGDGDLPFSTGVRYELEPKINLRNKSLYIHNKTNKTYKNNKFFFWVCDEGKKDG